MQLFSTIKHSQPRIREEEMILLISSYFKCEIAQTIAIQHIKTMEQLSNDLSRIERNTNNNQNSIIQT